MSEKIKIAFLEDDQNKPLKFEATPEEIEKIFEYAKHIPKRWLDMDIDRIAQDVANMTNRR